jgi:hypothetical protein
VGRGGEAVDKDKNEDEWSWKEDKTVGDGVGGRVV